MEQRLARFLDMHDKDNKLRDEMVQFQRMVWGADTIVEATAWAQAGGNLIADNIDSAYLTDVTTFLQRFIRCYEGRRILITENGYLGSGLEDTRPGDVVCFISGTQVPHILRPVPGKQSTFTLVGEAYIHGIMDNGNLDFTSMNFNQVTIV